MRLSISSRKHIVHTSFHITSDENSLQRCINSVSALANYLASAIAGQDYQSTSDVMRWLLNTIPNSDTFRLYNALFQGTSSSGISFYASHPMQKWLQRQQKVNPTNPMILCISGHLALIGRSFLQAVELYTSAYELYPHDPLINMCLGVALIHRAMSRLEANRQMQLLRGFSFMFQYYELVEDVGHEKRAEALYNLGRSFHQIGEVNWASVYYEWVLEGTGDFYKSQAAYNLSLIYVGVGSPLLARGVLRKYCSV
jgi:tetratricopeptide (TPR) repeat protein